MNELPACPSCKSSYTYIDQALYICPECGQEWTATSQENDSKDATINDVNGKPLADGDSVTVIKDLKVKGTSKVIKVGTKVKNIRLAHGDHDIDCKVDGIGAIKLKSIFTKKV